MRSILVAAALAMLPLAVSAQPYGSDGGPRDGMMQGMGPGMMHGQGMGPGMMQGQGMGHGMMQGQGMGHGMKGDWVARLEELGITDEQRAKILAVHKESRAKMLDLADQMRDLRWNARKRVEAILTPEQREKLRATRPPHG